MLEQCFAKFGLGFFGAVLHALVYKGDLAWMFGLIEIGEEVFEEDCEYGYSIEADCSGLPLLVRSLVPVDFDDACGY